MDLGWTKSWRKRWESDLATYPNANHLFQYLIDSASYKERDTSFRYQCVHLQAGDVLIGTKSAATRTGLTRQSVRTCLEYLKSTTRITIRSTKRFSIITILKWDTYQGDDTAIDQEDNHQTNQQVTINQPSSNHIQEVKELEKDQNPIAPSRRKPSAPVRGVTWGKDFTGNEMFLGITEEMISGWTLAYPALNIPQQLCAMHEWYVSNPLKRKKNIYRFITNWLARHQERGR